MISTDVLLNALSTRLTERKVLDQITNGFTAGMPVERTPVPFAYLDTLIEQKFVDTNTSRLRKVFFSVHVCQKPLAAATALAKLVSDAFTFASLSVDQGTVLNLKDPRSRWLEEDYFFHVVMDFTTTYDLGPVNYSPP